MTVPLPGGMADKLIAHMGGCPQCRAAKVHNNPRYCPTGRDLIRLTLIERHDMTNEERRNALNKARRLAVAYAERADRHYATVNEDGPEVTLALMWAAVANALKDGDPVHDGADGRPTVTAEPLVVEAVPEEVIVK